MKFLQTYYNYIQSLHPCDNTHRLRVYEVSAYNPSRHGIVLEKAPCVRNQAHIFRHVRRRQSPYQPAHLHSSHRGVSLDPAVVRHCILPSFVPCMASSSYQTDAIVDSSPGSVPSWPHGDWPGSRSAGKEMGGFLEGGVGRIEKVNATIPPTWCCPAISRPHPLRAESSRLLLRALF